MRRLRRLLNGCLIDHAQEFFSAGNGDLEAGFSDLEGFAFAGQIVRLFRHRHSILMSVPSYWLKLARAEQHLIDLKAALIPYLASNPYEMRLSIEGKNKRHVYRLHFTSQPSDLISLIGADLIYNLRSGLDHLASLLVPKSERGSMMFPIFFEGVWDEGPPGENLQRVKDRQRWISATKHVHPDAVTILKELQLPNDAGDRAHFHSLTLLNRLSNTDRHKKLPIRANALLNPRASWTDASGTRMSGGLDAPVSGLEDRAGFSVPKDAVDVQIEGTPSIVLRVAKYRRHIGSLGVAPIPLVFEELIAYVRGRVMTPLSKFTFPD